jgi:SAM-dependent methyltransferase
LCARVIAERTFRRHWERNVAEETNSSQVLALHSDIHKTLQGMVRVKSMQVKRDSHHYIALSYLYEWMRQQAFPVAKGVLLDYGCGGQPYRELFAEKVTCYIGADVAEPNDTRIDLRLEPNQPVPLPAASVDTILANQTLEHVPDVDFYLAECERLLRQDGILILTAPMQWRHHEVPYDYFRFTKYGLIELLSRHGFELRNITPCGGVYALLGQIFLSHLNERGFYKKFVYRLVNRAALWLDKKIPDPDDTLNWMCIAVKSRS